MTKLAHITDLHLDQWSYNLDSALEQLAVTDLDLLLIGGDNGNEEGLSRTWPFAPMDEKYRSFFGAYGSNQLMGDVILSQTIRPAVLFCGHTHQAARWDEFGFPMINSGSDYQEVRVTIWDLEI